MSECIYQTKRHKVVYSYDGFQVWERMSLNHDIWGYLRTFKVLAQAIKFIENIEKLKK